ncbi:MAG TPA: pseudaminic acid biosynthesis-associated methylase [Chthoniobacter sp.]|nr:pseudaminic acid biosynthesis-associated methylase [Chthoniobacter sp.]
MTPKQLEAWQGEFGEAYTERNVEDWRKRLPGFRRAVDALPIRRVLEVGCNRGHNLVAFSELIGADSEIIGIEPNGRARQVARTSSSQISVLEGNAFDLPFKDGYFDLVFTAGVLIHIGLADLPKALAEIYRTSRRYILAMEYFAETETVIPYRGREDLLWKRNFLQHYQTQFPDLKLVREGFLSSEEGWDSVTWWLLEKPQI